MPLTPDESAEKNKGKKNLQFERAVRDLMADLDEAVAYYTGNPVYVGLPAYLQYKVQADHASDAGPITLEAVDQALYERYSQAGWTLTIVTDHTASYYWARLKDSRGD